MPPNHTRPPGWALNFFRWYCNPALSESIEGDLEERFEENLLAKGPFKAKLLYCLDIIRFMNRFTLRKQPNTQKTSLIGLFIQRLVQSYRFLKRHQRYSLINLTGLTLGLAAALMIIFFVQNERSFDRFFENSERIYRLNNIYQSEDGGRSPLANSSPVFAREIPKSIAAFEKATRMRYAMRTVLSIDELSFYEDYGYYADSLFFEIFSYELLEGDPYQALDEPNTIVVTEALAMKYFKRPRPMGEFLTLNGSKPLKITGILAPIPPNSHLNFNFLISFSSYEIPSGYSSDLNSWWWGGFLTYALVAKGTDIDEVKEQTQQFITDNTGDSGFRLLVHLQALHDIYLGSADFPDDLNSHIRSGSQFTVYALTVIAILILIICAFNYTNLTAAMALQRGKEMGIRKVLGANNRSIRWQLFSDAFLLILIGLCLAYLLLWVAQPGLSSWLDWNMNIDIFQSLYPLPVALASSFLLAFLISGYPALFFQRLTAVAAIRRQFTGSYKGNLSRRLLVSLQFCISLGLLAATLIMKDQLQYMSNQSMGIDKDQLLTIKMLPSDLERHYATLKSQWELSADIASVTRSERIVGDVWPVNVVQPLGKDDSEGLRVAGNLVGLDFLRTHGVAMKSGRFFSNEYPGDTIASIVINQATADALGMEEPLGKEVMFLTGDSPRRIIGVMEDFNYSSLRQQIGPMALAMPFIDLEQITIRVTPGNMNDKVASIERTWNKITDGLPLDLQFLDSQLARLYTSEQNLGSMVTFFSLMAIILASLGLYGLISYNNRRRLKEISIRKIIGASRWSLLQLLCREYALLLILGALLAIPVSFLLLQRWLNQFAYGIDLNASYFIIALLAFTALCSVTIGGQIMYVLRQNPVKHLRED